MKRNIHIPFEFHCSICGNTSDLDIEVESSSDYFLIDVGCPHCGEPFPDNIDKEVDREVSNYYDGRATIYEDR